MNRADRMYRVLKDGRWHSHREITAGGPWFLCNNAASDLRKRGFEITYKKINGVNCYRLSGGLSEPDTGGVDETAKGLGRSATLSGSESLFELPRGAYQDVA